MHHPLGGVRVERRAEVRGHPAARRPDRRGRGEQRLLVLEVGLQLLEALLLAGGLGERGELARQRGRGCASAAGAGPGMAALGLGAAPPGPWRGCAAGSWSRVMARSFWSKRSTRSSVAPMCVDLLLDEAGSATGARGSPRAGRGSRRRLRGARSSAPGRGARRRPTPPGIRGVQSATCGKPELPDRLRVVGHDDQGEDLVLARYGHSVRTLRGPSPAPQGKRLGLAR